MIKIKLSYLPIIPLVIFFTLLFSGDTHAADMSKFNPGRIIDDAVFYNKDSMTATQIQTFLNSKVSACNTYTYGTSPHQAVPCLKDYRETTNTKSADTYCKGYPEVNQSAAEIIKGVADSCGINPQVLIVTLQKEQALITDTWPRDRWLTNTDGNHNYQYRSAMGYGCPDTALCDNVYYGFFNQVYYAARQFKRYQATPDSYSYVAGRNNNIAWNPSTSCGYSTVYIENQATAGLYNYTPYQPNTAALRSSYGSGDTCSSYGNRNFYSYFTDWFGSTQSNVPRSNIYLPDGEYSFIDFQSAVLDTQVPGSINETSVTLNVQIDSTTQKWLLTRTYDNFYKIKNIASNYYLEVMGGRAENGTNVVVYQGNDSCAQKWSIILSDNHYILLSACSGKALSVNDTILQIYDKDNSERQYWSIKALDSAPVANGTYTIATTANTTLDIQNGSTLNGAKISIWARNGTKAQEWQISRSDDGFYAIKNPISGKALDVVGGGIVNGTSIVIYQSNSTCAQKWQIKKTNDSYSIISACSNKALDVVAGAISTLGMPVVIYDRNNTKAQQWHFEQFNTAQAIENGTYELVTGVSDKYALTVNKGDLVNGANIQINLRNNSDAQKFIFAYNPQEDAYTIVNSKSNKRLDVVGGGTTNGTRIVQYQANDTCAQLWKVQKISNDTYEFYSACSGKAMEVIGGRAVDSADVLIYQINHTNAQRWTLIKQ